MSDILPHDEKPFRVSASWLNFAVGTAAESPHGESLYSSAAELCRMITERDYVLVPPHRWDLVMEIISVAELYHSGYHMDSDDRKTAATAKRLIKRAKEWMQNKGS